MFAFYKIITRIGTRNTATRAGPVEILPPRNNNNNSSNTKVLFDIAECRGRILFCGFIVQPGVFFS